ncbi:hypothetical protein BDK51DRAFT_26834 [Blyttiomyces helicus]|uniref:Uncharacterized protein n=1 Tax=Blyttiomyces helicus TaxID=388810 RepID=A0A4P9WFG2_9FUNG|nr:hypothetical protein BDK51DRAFT_26834 [Blyttiomyces helicus]|eukprot:RKO90048.1 hypothetical protein BDK51DRAFT_26834 [Blyttiomyces helicus]
MLATSAAALLPFMVLVTAAPASADADFAFIGRGTQNYLCQAGIWTLENANATLFEGRKAVGKHFFNRAFPSFRLDSDGSVIGCTKEFKLASPQGPTNVPWLLLDRDDAISSPTGVLSQIKFVAREDTHAGVPASLACTAGETELRVPYQAKYVFAKNTRPLSAPSATPTVSVPTATETEDSVTVTVTATVTAAPLCAARH